jgi:hypothetical protein
MGIPLPPLSVLLRDALKDYRAALPVPTMTFGNIEPPPSTQLDGIRNPETVKKVNQDVTLFPRRKAGQAPQEGGKGPVIITVDRLEKFYGMPLHIAAKKLVQLHVKINPCHFLSPSGASSQHCRSFSILTVLPCL